MLDDQDRALLGIAIADDHALVRSAMARLVRGFEDMTVIAEAGDGDTLLAVIARGGVDLAIIDAAMPRRDGFETVRALTDTHPSVRTLILSMYTSPEYVQRAREVGAGGFVAKDVNAPTFADTIRRVARGGGFVVAPAGLEADSDRAAAQGQPGSAGIELTVRQREVLRLVVEGLRTRDIAERLCLSVKTIETHRAELMRRLGVRNMAELVREALRLDLTPRDP